MKWNRILGIAGGLVLGASAFLPWFSCPPGRFCAPGQYQANRIPALILLRYTDKATAVRLGYLAIALGALILIASLLRPPTQAWLTLLFSVLGLAMVVTFFAELLREVKDAGTGSVFDVMRPGTYLAALGALLGLIAAFGGFGRQPARAVATAPPPWQPAPPPPWESSPAGAYGSPATAPAWGTPEPASTTQTQPWSGAPLPPSGWENPPPQAQPTEQAPAWSPTQPPEQAPAWSPTEQAPTWPPTQPTEQAPAWSPPAPEQPPTQAWSPAADESPASSGAPASPEAASRPSDETSQYSSEMEPIRGGAAAEQPDVTGGQEAPAAEAEPSLAHCPSCGRETQPGMAFCSQCGTRLQA